MVISIIGEREDQILSFLKLADSIIESFEASHKRMDPDGTVDLPRRLTLNPLTETEEPIENAMLSWSRQCVVAKKYYSLGRTEKAWAMLLESAQAAGGFHVATLASIAFRKDGCMTSNEFKSLFAKTGGNKRAEKIRLVELFSIELFAAGNWKSTKQAKTAIWPKVKEKANILGWNMSDETGPETLYKWLLSHKKIHRLQANA